MYQSTRRPNLLTNAQPAETRRASVVDLFCGAGGLTHGFRKEGFVVLAGVDLDPTCEYAYETNNKATFIHKSVEEITPSEVTALYDSDDIPILVGCAPCQRFSKYTKRKLGDEEKWALLDAFGTLVVESRPMIVSMENVPELRNYSVFRRFVTRLESSGYHVTNFIVNCVDYGVPQTRVRLVLFASQYAPVAIIPPTHRHPRSVASAIRHLPPLCAGQVDKQDPLHRASALSELNLERLRHTPEGGGWKNWPEHLRLACHIRETGKSYGSVYGRMRWDEPAPTMTTQCNGLGNGRFGHPEQHRAITLREAALFQTFPRHYQFTKPGQAIILSDVARHIGNAVPPRLGQVIARTIRRHLRANDAL